MIANGTQNNHSVAQRTSHLAIGKANF